MGFFFLLFFLLKGGESLTVGFTEHYPSDKGMGCKGRPSVISYVSIRAAAEI